MDSKTTLAELGNFTVIAPILLTSKVNALPHTILEDIGAILSKRLTSQQICDIALEFRIYLLKECFINRTILVIKILETPISSVLDVSASTRAWLST